MRYFVILSFCIFLLASCSKVETATNIIPISLDKTPTVQENVSLKSVTPKVDLNAKQQKYLNESLPPKVREILEKAEIFEILAEMREREIRESDLLNFQPNRIVKNFDEKEKKEILEAFYFDASREDSPASCYEPHHQIRAIYQGETVEIEICFDCAKFIVTSSFGKFEGTFVRENRKSEDLFNRIIENKSIEIKQ